MDGKDIECTVCHSPLVYHKEQREMTCVSCHRRFKSNAECVKGHYVCDECHSKGGLSMISARCMDNMSRNPISIAMDLMDYPEIHMHGPEHHVLVGSAILTAYANSVDDFDLRSALDEMERRGRQVPGGICGLWGSCGAAISCGTAYSIITGSTPLSESTWGECNTLTSECLRRIGEKGGPRCCKRDSFTAILVACEYIHKRLGVRLQVPDRVVCHYSERNAQCQGRRCPYSRLHA